MYWDNGKENGNYYNGLSRGYIGIVMVSDARILYRTVHLGCPTTLWALLVIDYITAPII